MNAPRHLLVAALLWLAAAPFTQGQVVRSPLTDAPIVAKPIADFTVSAGTAQSVVNLKKTFAIEGLVGKAVRFSTNLGNIDVELLADDAPATVANFLSYANRPNDDARFNYTNNIFHRSVAGFVIQGGAYQVSGQRLNTIVTDPPVTNEFKVSNTRGTIAMAKLGTDPNSATDQWFFNESDDNAANLDAQNGGFTVFGRIIGQRGLDVMDAIAAVPVYNAGSPLDELPLVNYQTGDDLTADMVIIKQITVAPLTPKANGEIGLLKLKITGNTNPGLVLPDLQGRKLYLNFAAGQKGSATITMTAKNNSKQKTLTSFTVTVE